MTLEKIKEHLRKLREKMEKMKSEEKKWMTMEKHAEDAEKLKIIRKSSLTIEELQYLNGIKKEEIELIKERRKGETGGNDERKTSEKA
ncbi:MAG: hypothetical protein K6A90_10055 [Lachnospiraceae bacterium]|nr:hypothetical protein [Lachnospiraceae bacterium]